MPGNFPVSQWLAKPCRSANHCETGGRGGTHPGGVRRARVGWYMLGHDAVRLRMFGEKLLHGKASS
jgi:hypothetical protein